GVVAALGGGHRLGQYLFASAAGGLAAPRVDQPPHRDGGEPRPRVVRGVLRPDAQRVQQGFLQRVLGGVEVLAAAHQAREDPGDEGPQLALVHPVHRLVGHAAQPMISRTSIHSYSGSPPGPGPPETNAATSSARSCDSTSIMYQPATRSLVSGCGPSVVTGAASGPPQRTQVFSGVSACPSTYSPLSSSVWRTFLRKAMCPSMSTRAQP